LQKALSLNPLGRFPYKWIGAAYEIAPLTTIWPIHSKRLSFYATMYKENGHIRGKEVINKNILHTGMMFKAFMNSPEKK